MTISLNHCRWAGPNLMPAIVPSSATSSSTNSWRKTGKIILRRYVVVVVVEGQGGILP